MTLYDRARQDNARILTSTVGFTVPVVFVSPTDESYSTRATFSDVGVRIDPETGLPIIGRSVTMTVNEYDSSGNYVFGDESLITTEGNWKLTFTSQTDSEQYKVSKIMPDRTFNSITFNLIKIAEAS